MDIHCFFPSRASFALLGHWEQWCDFRFKSNRVSTFLNSLFTFFSQIPILQAQRNLTKARTEYLKNKILYTELQEILTDLEVRGQENTLKSEEEKVCGLKEKLLVF